MMPNYCYCQSQYFLCMLSRSLCSIFSTCSRRSFSKNLSRQACMVDLDQFVFWVIVYINFLLCFSWVIIIGGASYGCQAGCWYLGLIIIRVQYITILFLHLIIAMDTENDPNSNQQFQLAYYDEQNSDYYQVSAPILISHSSEYSQPPMLSYSYSGISNASSTPQFALHSSRVSEEPIFSFVFMKTEKLYLSLQRVVKDLRQAVALQDDVILYLLYKYQWSKEKIYQNYYLNADSYVLINKTLKENSKNNPQTKQATCLICQNQANLVTNMLCQHAYCLQCWRYYINEQLNQNKIFFTCMNKCEHSIVLLHSFVQKIFPQLFELYRKMACINYSTVNKAISYCPSYKKECDLFCERPQNSCQICVECQCGEFFCFFCQKEPHYPATCEDVVKWMKLVNDQESSTKWIQKNTKSCPSCKNPVEKYIGCSKIKCVCGAQFCYQCNGKWDENHKSSKGQCLSSLIRKSSLQQRANTTDFMKLHQKVLAIGRTCKKHLTIIDAQWILSKFHGVRKEVMEAWQILKWSSIVSFLYKRSEGENNFAEEFIESIGRLMEAIEKMKNIFSIFSAKDMMGIGDEVQNRRQILKKNKDIWFEAWRNNN